VKEEREEIYFYDSLLHIINLKKMSLLKEQEGSIEKEKEGKDSLLKKECERKKRRNLFL
jgi:hypothetical protein